MRFFEQFIGTHAPASDIAVWITTIVFCVRHAYFLWEVIAPDSKLQGTSTTNALLGSDFRDEGCSIARAIEANVGMRHV
jgi:hypothetical protein